MKSNKEKIYNTNTMNNNGQEIQAIIDRNKRVERDKAWERSITRRGSIALFTYITAYIYMRINNVESPEMQALIPAVAFIFSTLTLPPLKKWWLER
jgi:hypothetical protein|tara:strand:- start:7494 stop:7781 length:288 start_codon:yes stop_codon:yes gene_type:complete